MTHKYDIVTPNRALAAIVGKYRLLESEVSDKVDAYIKEYHLLDPADNRIIHADANLLKILGEPKCSEFEMYRLLSAYLDRNTGMLTSADVLTANTAELVAPTKGRKKIEKQIGSLQRDVKRVLKKYANRSIVEELDYQFLDVLQAAPCWKIMTMKVSTAVADRTCNMLAGPLFSCKEYPWPKDCGAPAVPVAQVDLGVASKLRGLPLGDGLLQVFWGCSSGQLKIRVIPRAVVASARLTPTPVLRESSGCFPPLDWTKKDGVFDEIVGFSNPLISSTVEVDLDGPWQRIPRDLRAVAERANATQGNDSGFNMFGTFRLVQYWAKEKPPCFMSFDSERDYIWGDCGTAHVFYQIEKDGVTFSGDYSCY